ncbi:T9SS sorting signal type C domain-containing protein [Flavobacterium sp. Sd200]|uniref:lamin tail domain-containing protein n=1 Tax=Flavobacterium sp. Sd200 TaxID=2692211 RepID=UPI001371CCFF|nr:lamin tail domain-containing protein [Flavobacterium sp. Sd200]MXN92374.1 T9SS sorting signal type C domain-containing protein [Flavobacterium sp. Sd200]
MKTFLRKALRNAFSMSLFMAATASWGQVSLPATSPFSENFDTTPGAAGTTYPAGWVSYNGTTADNAMTVGTGTSTAGANYNYGSKIGILGSGSAFSTSSIVLAISNTTGKAGLSLSYDVIKIREQGRSNSFNLEVSTTSATTGYTAVVGGAYASGTIAEGTVTPYVNIDLSSVDNTAGTVWIRWSYTELGGSGSRDGIALDNVSLSWGAPTVLTAPVAALATAVTTNSFTARWTTVAGADSYRLDVSESPTFVNSSPTTDLFFSEYVEGSGTNKYLEIYNGTGAAINLTDYKVRLYANGAATPTNDVALTGTIANGATIVLKNNTASAYTGAATVVAAVNFNGDDAIALYKVSTASNVDIFGRIGEDPGVAWTSTSNTTLDKTLVRKPGVSAGVTVNPTSGFPTLETEWDVFNIDDVTHLGSHTYGGITSSYLSGYENLTVNDTLQVVNGLNHSTTYYYRVRAAAGSSVSDNSNTISVTTLASTAPELTLSELASFGTICINQESIPALLTISGHNLTTADITVGPVDGFTFSETEEGTYTPTLTLAQSGGTLLADIYVRFEPIDAITYSDTLTVAGGGAADVTANVIGAGVNTRSTVSLTSADALSISTASIVAEVTTEGCTPVEERGVVYGLTPSPQLNASGVLNQTSGTGLGSYTISLTGLSSGTVYYVRAYSVNDGGISYSIQTTITTPSVGTPVAIDATDEDSVSFTANWNAVAGADSYRLDVSESPTFGNLTAATDLFFSEYVEGSASNKYIEIYNGTGADVDLSDYRVRLYANGNTTATNDVLLSGILENDDVLVIRNSAATIYTGTATVNAAVNFNGDDAIVLYRISTATNVDIFGNIGEDPGTAWSTATHSTVDKTLVRKSTVHAGVTVNPVSGFPTLETEWDVLDQDDVTSLGAHNYAGQTPSFVTGYEDLLVNATSQEVSGLNAATTYYYRVRAVAGNTSVNSNTIEANTTAAARFALRTAAPNAAGNEVMVYKQNGALTISSLGETVRTVNVFDVNGRLLFTSDKFNDNEITLSGISMSQQVLIVKVGTESNQTVTKKVVY